jgi:hypothetical protein
MTGSTCLRCDSTSTTTIIDGATRLTLVFTPMCYWNESHGNPFISCKLSSIHTATSSTIVSQCFYHFFTRPILIRFHLQFAVININKYIYIYIFQLIQCKDVLKYRYYQCFNQHVMCIHPVYCFHYFILDLEWKK